MISTRKFGALAGQDIIEATLRSDTAEISILNYGCVIRDWRVSTKSGPISVVLGLEEFAHYVEHSPSFGIIAGRVANRTAKGKFTLNGVDYELPINDGENHLHGGMVGLGRRVWDMSADENKNKITLKYLSPDGEEGYPASIDFVVTFQLSGTTLTCEMFGTPDAQTPINLAQHSYYNLNGSGDTREHVVHIEANSYTPVDATQIPTGVLQNVDSSRFDFSSPTTFNASDSGRLGVDHNLVLNPNRNKTEPSAKVYSPQSNLELKLWTDEPGIQLFNAPEMNIPVAGLNAQKYGPFAGLCLEAQHFPDALNRPEWPSIIYSPDRPYYQKLVVQIEEK